MNATVTSGLRWNARRIASVASFSILTALPLKAQGTCASGLAPVQTRSGPVCGAVLSVSEGRVQAFKGIPYAQAGRWEDPAPPRAWTDPLDATKFGPICPQKTTSTDTQDEDCLSINVWRPAEEGSGLPVMLFIYGGAFIEGFSASPLLDGVHLAAGQKAVVVSFNYRLGALGFLAGSFEDGTTLAGNYGFKDQQMALRWVHDNIGSFGGDASNVTLFGESAGAMSAGLHLLSAPASKDYFQRVILESNPLALPYKTPEEAALFATTLQTALGCSKMQVMKTGNEGPSDDGLACMRKSDVTFQEIVAAEGSKAVLEPATDKGFVDFLVWAPVKDGTVITADPIKGKIDKPAVLGTNLNEGNLFVDLIKSNLPTSLFLAYRDVLKAFFGKDLAARVAAQYPEGWSTKKATKALSNVLNDYIFTCSNRYLAGQATDSGRLWAYQFRPLTTYDIYQGNVPDCVQSSDPTVQSPICHGDELPYVFNSWTNVNVTPSADETALTSAITGYWGSFAAAGTPKGTTPWSAFGSDKNYLLLAKSTSVAADPFQSICAFWDPIGYDLRNLPNTLFKAAKAARR